MGNQQLVRKITVTLGNGGPDHRLQLLLAFFFLTNVFVGNNDINTVRFVTDMFVDPAKFDLKLFW
mgnify:CR=1 FL=1